MPTDNETSTPAQGIDAAKQRICRVAALQRQLTALNTTLTAAHLSEFDDADLIVRLDYVEGLNSNFEMAHSALEEGGSEIDGDARFNFVTLFFEVKAKLTRQLNLKRASQSIPRSSTIRQFSLDDTTPQRKMRLPELKIPQFAGSYTEWPGFFAMFTTVIDSECDLSKIEKFQHLRVSLSGAALDTISSLDPTEDNYDKALELLKNRFDNKLLNFQTHIKEIFGLKVVDKGSAFGLRQLSDKLNAHMRALQTICKPEQIADGLLVYLVTSKLDSNSQAKWEEDLPINKLPTWSSMASFLERRCRMLENLESAMGSRVANQQVNRKSHGNGRNALVASATSPPACTYCDSEGHFIANCPRFEALPATLRFKEVKRLHLCLNCLKKGHMLKKCKSGHCRHCPSKHHSLLHINNTTTDSETSSSQILPEQSPPTSSMSALVSSLPPSYPPETLESVPRNNVLLATAIVLVQNRFGVRVPCRAILDSASQLNFITARAANQLQLKFKPSFVTISGIGDGNFVADKSTDVSIQSREGDFSASFSAVIVPIITEYQPNINLNMDSWKIPQNVKLADPDFCKRGRIDILIGAGLFFDIMSVGQIRLEKNLPVLQKTRLGWVISGGVGVAQRSVSLATATMAVNEEESLADIIKSFWQVEHNFEPTSPFTSEETFCEYHFQQNTIRLSSGEYSVRLPKRENHCGLGESYERALHRFKVLEKKLHKQPDVKNQYIAFMNEYIALNHMSLVPSLPKHKQIFFLPHHCVHKVDSTTTKLRVVFDGSAKTTTGISLNDTLYAGPTIQPKLFDTLLRFRFFKVALSGDICKMYRCVRVSEPDNYLQCILWRNDPTEEIKIYRLDTVTYGTKPAAFLAIRSMVQLSLDEEALFPIGAEIVRRDFYVDDMISGGNSVDEVIEIRKHVSALLRKGNFDIRKWCSNDPAVLKDIPSSEREQFLKFHDGTDITKTLGLVWNPQTDNFIFTFTPVMESSVITKRTILSSIARLYDPLGLIGPVITKAKVIMQNLWKHNLQWDESLPQFLHSAWLQFVSNFSVVDKFMFPRFVSVPRSTIQIHAFCDASLSAYGACIYVRSELNGAVRTTLLCSKSRVAPLKVLTVPKLELAAATLLAELLDGISKTLSTDCEYHCWSNSMVVLSWLREQPSNFNVFVSNRVSRIQCLTNKMTWHYVSTTLNPSDILSRGASPVELLNSNMWKNGPQFLHEHPSNWPQEMHFISELPERRRIVLTTTSTIDLSLDCKFYNSFSKIQRIFAYVYRFIMKTRNKLDSCGQLTAIEIKLGTHYLIRNIQQNHFMVENKSLIANGRVSASSKLYSLAPIIDSSGLVRVGGRLQNSFLNFEAQHPIILPKSHPITKALILYFHEKFLHAGPQCLLATIRQQYWPIGGRKTVSSVISKCVRCFRLKPKIAQHIMGNLPQDRVQANRAFSTTGVDFCGPFYYKSEVRSRPPVKTYICIFICFATKAVHLELVQDLSTSSFLSALSRFISIRGKPKTIWSDNATNFVGARNELAELRKLFFDQTHLQHVHQQCLEDGIEWKFIPPRSPHFGGLWEAAVKSAKFHFYRAVGRSVLAYDDLRTLVCQISAILNSRPLCPISESPDDLEVLTPAHFLVGAPLATITTPDITDLSSNRLNRWQRISYMQQIFWKKWSCSYLSLLQERSKWRAPNVSVTKGIMVLLKDENLPPLKWHLGRVVDLVRGDDDVVRVALVKTINGISRRAVAKLAVLPIEPEDVESQDLPTGGECLVSSLLQ